MQMVRRWARRLLRSARHGDLYLFSDFESRRLCSRILPYDALCGQAPSPVLARPSPHDCVMN